MRCKAGKPMLWTRRKGKERIQRGSTSPSLQTTFSGPFGVAGGYTLWYGEEKKKKKEVELMSRVCYILLSVDIPRTIFVQRSAGIKNSKSTTVACFASFYSKIDVFQMAGSNE